MRSLREIIPSRLFREVLEGASAATDMVLIVLDAEGRVVARAGWEGRCRLAVVGSEEVSRATLVPTQCVATGCTCFASQIFSPVTSYATHLGMVVGCSPVIDVRHRSFVELLSRIFGEIATREIEIAAISSDVVSKYQALSILYEVSRNVATRFSEADVVSLLLEAVAQAFGVEMGDVYLRSDIEGDFRCRSRLGESLPPEGMPVNDEGQAFLRWFVRQGEARLDEDEAGRVLFNRTGAHVLLVPLTYFTPGEDASRTLGVVALVSPKADSFSQEQRQFVISLSAQVALGVVNCRAVDKIRVSERLQRDLELARDIQKGLFPRSSPSHSGFRIHGVCRPASRVGGDYYDYFVRNDGRLVIIIADVAGHDLGSALLMASVRSSLRAHALVPGASPGSVLTMVNEIHHADFVQACSFVSVFLGVYDPSTHRLDYVLAGHNPPLLFRRDGSRVSLGGEGILIGILDEYIFQDRTIGLPQGSRLVAFTDGIVEAMDHDERQFGVERLVGVVQLCPQVEELFAELERALREFTGGEELQDDVTLVVLDIIDETEVQ